MRPDTKALLGEEACSEGQAWLDTTGYGPVDAYDQAPRGDWIALGCSLRPMTPERLRRLVAVGALYARAVLPLVLEERRELAELCVDLAERHGRGEAIDVATAKATATKVAAAVIDDGMANKWSYATSDRRVALAIVSDMIFTLIPFDGFYATHTAADNAAWVAVDATIVAKHANMMLPSADDARKILGPAEDWL